MINLEQTENNQSTQSQESSEQGQSPFEAKARETLESSPWAEGMTEDQREAFVASYSGVLASADELSKLPWPEGKQPEVRVGIGDWSSGNLSVKDSSTMGKDKDWGVRPTVRLGS